jgi:ABC-type nitrate/sulfonate/bicarbonate transport system ATPase subunit
VPEAITLADRIVVMTARPGRIRRVSTIELAHPRDSTHERFREYERVLYADLDEELVKSFTAETRALIA